MSSAVTQTKLRAAKASWRFVLLGVDEQWRSRLGRAKAVLCPDQAAVLQALERASSDSIWISADACNTDQLASALVAFMARHSRPRTFRHLLMLQPPRTRLIPVLHRWFDRVVGEVPGFQILPLDQLSDILSAPISDRRDLFLGGVVDERSGTLALARGNFETVTVPLSLFRPSGKARPDFAALSLDDYGQTLRFGHYEAAADAILYEIDEQYRKRRIWRGSNEAIHTTKTRSIR